MTRLATEELAERLLALRDDLSPLRREKAIQQLSNAFQRAWLDLCNELSTPPEG